MSVAGTPLKLVPTSALRSPSVTSATSRTRTTLPSAPLRRMISPNSSGLSSRPRAETLS